MDFWLKLFAFIKKRIPQTTTHISVGLMFRLHDPAAAGKGCGRPKGPADRRRRSRGRSSANPGAARPSSAKGASGDTPKILIFNKNLSDKWQMKETETVPRFKECYLWRF